MYKPNKSTDIRCNEMSNLNEGILLVMKWISDNDSVDTEALKHKQADAYLVYDDAIRINPYSRESKSAYAEHEALFAAHLGRADIADMMVDNYFDVTGENKLDYIDALDKEGE